MRRALRRGSRRKGRHLVLHLLDRGDGDPARVAVVATRRVGGAVQRNRAKRLLREAVRVVPLPDGHDVAIVARSSAAAATAPAVQRDLERMFE